MGKGRQLQSDSCRFLCVFAAFARLRGRRRRSRRFFVDFAQRDFFVPCFLIAPIFLRFLPVGGPVRITMLTFFPIFRLFVFVTMVFGSSVFVVFVFFTMVGVFIGLFFAVMTRFLVTSFMRVMFVIGWMLTAD
jgi:hypothetical protein